MSKRKVSVSGSHGLSRREFLVGTAATGGILTIVPRFVLGGSGYVPPSDRLNLAIIGTGGQGIVNIRALLSQADVQIIAIADPNEESDYSAFYYGGTAGRKPALELIRSHNEKLGAEGGAGKCADYLDFRKMLDNEKSIDAVVVATPDHAHAVTAMAAIQLGKHVYCEKPLAHSIYEVRKVTEAAREAEVATQMGNQGHSGEGIRQTCEWIWDGAIGEIREVHAWSDVGGWADGEKPVETPPVPPTFDWELWLGPALSRPYSPAYAPYNWRGWWDFGTGGIGDMACHNLDPAFWALHLKHPESVEAISTEAGAKAVSDESTVRYEFSARRGLPPVTVTWYDGPRRPPLPEGMEDGKTLGRNGIIFVGQKGQILCGGWGGPPQLLPKALADSYSPPPKSLLRSNGHHRDWLGACKGGPPPSSNFEHSGPLTEVVLLGNVAQRSTGKLVWDGPLMTVTNQAKPNQYVQSPYREGWEI
jgi:predicted dehydrogenase